MASASQGNQRGRFWLVCALAAFAALLATPAFAAKPEQLVDNIMPYQVFPRKGMTGSIPFITKASGALHVDVVNSSGTKVHTQDWQAATSASEPRALNIADVPVGGEYELRFSGDGRTQSIEHILVGELWIVGGQSNACGTEHQPQDPPVAGVHFLRGGRWEVAQDPFFPCFDTKNFVGPFRAAANTYYGQTGIPVGMMGWAFGGVPMSRFWDSDGKKLIDLGPLVTAHGKGASAFLWYQGESDANAQGIPVYKDRLTSMAAALRGCADNPNLTMVVVQLSYFISFDTPKPYFGRLRETQRQFCLEDPRAFLIPALPYPHIDFIHLNHDGYFALGHQIGTALADLNKTGKVTWQGPRPVEARFADASKKSIKVTFDSARELRLHEQPLGVPAGKTPRSPGLDWFVTDSDHLGFAEITKSQVTPDGKLDLSITGAEIQLDKAAVTSDSLHAQLVKTGYVQPRSVRVDGLSLILDFAEPLKSGARVSYGLMENSLCTLTDEQERPAATFADLQVRD